MEWQPENEIVIPQSDHTVYTYGLPVLRKEESGNAENQVLECRLGAAPSARQRAASESECRGLRVLLQGMKSGMVRQGGIPHPNMHNRQA
jgi:hypothetical protein